jgi:DNA-binding NtrC family response regulator
MPDTDGITLLKEWSDDGHVDVPVIMMSGHGTVETAVEATRLGAYDFIEKPLSIAKLLLTVQRALETADLQRENIGLKKGISPLDDPLGNSLAIQKLRADAARIAQHKTAVFISGESGTGKEVIARYLHKHSARASGPFVTVGVAGLARENPDAELFGSEIDGQVMFGSLEQANGGSLFLKDIADMNLNTQARLLSALENESLLRVGGREPVHIDVRVIAATRRNLADAVNAGTFRDDLFYHLNVVPLNVPPLRDRAEDIDVLVSYYLNFFAVQEGLPRREFSSGAKNRLSDYDWPGNARELKNLVIELG